MNFPLPARTSHSLLAIRNVACGCGLLLAGATAQTEALGSAEFSIHPVASGSLGAAIYQQAIQSAWPEPMLLSPGNVVQPLAFSTFLPPGSYALRYDLGTAADWEGGTPSLFTGTRGMAAWMDCIVLFDNVAVTETDPVVIGTIRDHDSVCAAAPRTTASACGAGADTVALGTGAKTALAFQQANLAPYTFFGLGTGTARSEYTANSIGGLGAEVIGSLSSQVFGRVATTPPVGVDTGSSLLQHLIVNLPFGATVTVQGSLELGAPGSSQRMPLFPNGGPNLFWQVWSGWWFDPPLAQGYEFTMQSASRFTRVTTPVGIDGDGQFELVVGDQSYGSYPEGQLIDLTAIVDPLGVPSFELFGIDPAVDSTDPIAFPVKLEFDTPQADFSMVPLTVRKLGVGCTPAGGCPSCSALDLDVSGEPVIGNASFAIEMTGAPQPGVGICLLNLGPCGPGVPFGCGKVWLASGAIPIGTAVFTGPGSCAGTGSFPLGLPNDPALFGQFLCVQGGVVCGGGGLALTNGLQLPIGS